MDTKSAESDPCPKANPNGVVPPATQVADAMRTLAHEKVAGPDHFRGAKLLHGGLRENSTILDELPICAILDVWFKGGVPQHFQDTTFKVSCWDYKRDWRERGNCGITALVAFAGRVPAPQNRRPPYERICENSAVFVPSDGLYIVRRLWCSSSFTNQRVTTLLIILSTESCY